MDYQALEFDYRRHPDQDAPAPCVHPVVIVGAGPVGLSAALDLASRGIRVVVVDDDRRLAHGSRAICFAKRTLEVWDRYGVGQRAVDKGVAWNVGRVFFGEREVWRFDLLPESGHRRPAFVNLQQYYAEGYLQDAARRHPRIELRWQNKVTSVRPRPPGSGDGSGVDVQLQTPEGPYELCAQWLVACDGSRSQVRQSLGLQAHGRVFRDRFLIADVRMQAPFPAERWFWFDPPFNPGRSVLLHMQPDNVWRVDFQLGWEADPQAAARPENVLPRLRALLGQDTPFELEWVSVYTFACERMETFRHGRVLFAGDAAHRVSPFGARGANSGVQDADNLAWKLALVLQGAAPEALLDSYAQERERAADENIAHSSRSTDFITPKSAVSRAFRNAVLNLAARHPFARALINSGRLSTPCAYADSPLNTPDGEAYAGAMAPGAPALDAPVELRDGTRRQPSWWLSVLGGGFVLALFADAGAGAEQSAAAAAAWSDVGGITPRIIVIEPAADAGTMGHQAPVAGAKTADARGGVATPPHGVDGEPVGHVIDTQGLLAQRYDGRPGTCYLIRPDQHIAARWRRFDAGAVRAALRRVLAQEPEAGAAGDPPCH
jgi:3-(3-hydroxy-phenyl)propionate hydroxylase